MPEDSINSSHLAQRIPRLTLLPYLGYRVLCSRRAPLLGGQGDKAAFVYSNKEQGTGASHAPGSQWKVTFFTPACRSVQKRRHSFLGFGFLVGFFLFAFGADIWKSKHGSDKLQVWTTDIYFINNMVESEGDNFPPLFFSFSPHCLWISFLFCLKQLCC